MTEHPKLPPVRNEPISLVLTARNDAAHLEEILTAWAAELDALSREYEILLVDDGSADDTVRVAGGLTTLPDCGCSVILLPAAPVPLSAPLCLRALPSAHLSGRSAV
jgi:hypothetical protein